MMRKLASAFSVAGLAAVTVMVPVQNAAAEGCVTHNEYDNLVWGLSTEQVANRFETDGWFITSGDEFFRRGYPTCWSADRKVVIWYDNVLGLTDHWDIRDR